jgi:hypothetical protein
MKQTTDKKNSSRHDHICHNIPHRPPGDDELIAQPSTTTSATLQLLDVQLIALTSCDMATQFTLFPQLITELRLEIWQLALPTIPRGKLLYPYQKGCWVFKELGLEPDPDGEDLHFIFDYSLLEQLHIELPLYSVNQEARNVTLEWLQHHRAIISRRSSSVYEILRSFNCRTDIMFVSAAKVEDFVVEPIERPHVPDMIGRHFSSAYTALRRIAVSSDGLQCLKDDGMLQEFFEFTGKISTVCVIDDAYASKLRVLETAGRDCVLQLADEPLARLKRRRASIEWEEFGDDGEALTRLKSHVEGLDGGDDFELEVQLVGLV